MSLKALKLNQVWRTCNKVRVLLAEKASFDIEENFKSLAKKDLISTSKFQTVLNNLDDEQILTEDELIDLTEFFANDEEKINWKNFLEVLQPQFEDNHENKEFITGLEWEDPMHINVLNQLEHRKVNLILTKIAHTCRLRDIIFEPYFQDYEMISKNNGTITIAHFRNVLNFLGITLGDEEFRLLVKKFMKHKYTINYQAFVAAIKGIIKWFEKNGHAECSEKSDCYPGKIIICECQKLQRPEFNLVAELREIDKPCHSCQIQKRFDYDFEQLMLRIKKHIFDNRIRTREFFEKFDCLRRGFITKSQFLRGLESIGISGLHRLYITENEHEEILKNYEDPMDIDRVAWTKFCDDIDEVFTIK